MSLAGKDLMVGGVTATALVATVVYMQYKFGKIEEEMNELRKESKNLAQYIELLEAKIANDLNSRGSHHQVRTPQPSQTPPPTQPAGSTVADREPQPSQIAHAGHSHGHSDHGNHHGHQHQHSHEHAGSQPNVREHVRSINPARATSHRHAPGDTKPVKAHHMVAPEPIVQDDDDAQEDVPSPPTSNRRQLPRATQVPMRNTRPVAKPVVVEEEKPESERRPAPVVSTGRPPAPSANGRSRPGSGPDKPKKFLPKDSDEVPAVPPSSKRNGSKSILKNGQSEIDPDLLADIESTTKSGKRNDNEKEGRVDSQSAAKERMMKTREIAAAIQKKREAEVAALPGGGSK